MTISKKKQPSSAEKLRNKYITSRYDGRSFRVRMQFHGTSVQATFDTLEDARAYRDRMLADATTDLTHRLVIEARQKKVRAEKTTLGSLLGRYASEVSIEKKKRLYRAAAHWDDFKI